MNRAKPLIAVGIISILLLLLLAGCGTDILKSSQHTPQEETSTEGEVPAEDTADETSADAGAASEADSDEAPAEGDSAADPTENPETNCSSLNPHPLAEGMAEQFGISYDQIMTWYCDGSAFSDILLALETEQLVDLTTEELLSMVDDSTWEEIWAELGVDK